MRRRKLGSARLVRGATLTCSLITGAHLGCGKIEAGPDLGTPSGGTLGTSSSGGTTATSSGGAIAAIGGGLVVPNDKPPPEPEPCDAFPGLDPPCSEEDVHGYPYSCLGSMTLTFEFPLTALAPPAEDLRLLCLPVDVGLGAGGMGGADGLETALGFGVSHLTPGSAGIWSEDSFSLTKPTDSVGGETRFSGGLSADCVQEQGESPESYSFAQVAVAQGDTILAQHRLLLHWTGGCVD